jgi:hypothetical protein
MTGKSLETDEDKAAELTRQVALDRCAGLEIRLDTPKGALGAQLLVAHLFAACFGMSFYSRARMTRLIRE